MKKAILFLLFVSLVASDMEISGEDLSHSNLGSGLGDSPSHMYSGDSNESSGDSNELSGDSHNQSVATHYNLTTIATTTFTNSTNMTVTPVTKPARSDGPNMSFSKLVLGFCLILLLF